MATDPVQEAQEHEAEIRRLTELLPAWFTERMMTDTWPFGLLLVTGQILAIDHIVAIRQDAAGGLWLDVELLQDLGLIGVNLADEGLRPILSPTGRTRASVNAAHVVAAMELADS